MVHQFRFQNLLFLIPMAIILGCILVANSDLFLLYPQELSTAMTFDLLFTMPLIYYFIIQKRSIPKTTIVPVLIVGIVVASIILPSEHQYYLGQFKTWVLPIVEVSIVTYLVISIRKAIRAFKKENTGNVDFFTAAKSAGGSFLPSGVSTLFATELSMFYYGFLQWNKRPLAVNEFSYHRTTSTRLMLSVFVFLILVEAVALHLVVQRWSDLAAWILTGLSTYACFQVLGILKSISRRPISIESHKLHLRYGIMAEVSIEWDNIEEAVEYKKEITKEEGIAFLSPFQAAEGHNVLISLKESEMISGFYGIKKECQKLVIYVDEPERFVKIVNKKFPSIG